jgi:hypothetical protein
VAFEVVAKFWNKYAERAVGVDVIDSNIRIEFTEKTQFIKNLKKMSSGWKRCLFSDLVSSTSVLRYHIIVLMKFSRLLVVVASEEFTLQREAARICGRKPSTHGSSMNHRCGFES